MSIMDFQIPGLGTGGADGASHKMRRLKTPSGPRIIAKSEMIKGRGTDVGVCGHNLKLDACPFIDEYRHADGRLNLAAYARAHPNLRRADNATFAESLKWNGEIAR